MKITIKELYERIVRLETKLDLIGEKDDVTRGKFYWIAAIMIVLEVLVLFIHVLYAAH